MAKLDTFTGALLVGAVLSTILFGVVTVQAFLYFSRFPGDPILLKRMVTILYILDAAHQACACHTIYYYAMSFRNPEVYARVVWSIAVFHTLEPILAVVVQLFLARRLHLLNRGWWPVVLAAVLLATGSFAFGIFSAVMTYISDTWVECIKYNWVVTIWLVLSAACDILIAGAITCSLLLSRSGFKSTDRLISKLIIWTVTTGIIPAFISIIQLGSFLALPESALPMCFDLVMAKLYTNSLLAFLNRRKSSLDSKRYIPARQEDIQLTALSNLREHTMEPVSVVAPGASFQSSNPKSIPRANFVTWPKESPMASSADDYTRKAI